MFLYQEIIRGLREAEKNSKAYNYKLEVITNDINDSESQSKNLKSFRDGRYEWFDYNPLAKEKSMIY